MFSALWMYAWDLRDEGLDHVLGFIRDVGLAGFNMASAYHAGWFIHPHNPHHRAYFTEDGVVYFHPRLDLYRDTKLKPKVAEVSRETDWFEAAGRQLDRYGLKMVAWTVCNHNTRMGLEHPDCTVRNVYGDSYPHALCPSNDHVRAYVIALCRDLATRYPMHAVQLESPGFMGLQHGHHHERDGANQSGFERQLMGLCFCESCTRKAETAGAPMAELKDAVRERLEAGFQAAPTRATGVSQTMAEFSAAQPGMAKLEQYRKETERSLLRAIKEGMKDAPEVRLFLLGGYDEAVRDVVDVFSTGVYGQKHPDVLKNVRAARGRTPEGVELHVGVRLGFDETVDGPEELIDIVSSIRQAGGTGVNFYNYSESPRRALEWIKPALESLRR